MDNNQKISLMREAVITQAKKGNPIAVELRKMARRHDHRDEIPVLLTAFNGMRNILEEYGNNLNLAILEENKSFDKDLSGVEPNEEN